jgi:hypothetical protein
MFLTPQPSCIYLHTEILFIDNNGFTDARGGQYTLTGSLDYVCYAGLENLFNLYADCTVQCSCCAHCCQPGDLKCNDWDEAYRLSDKDDRNKYLFSEDYTPTQVVNTSE